MNKKIKKLLKKVIAFTVVLALLFLLLSTVSFKNEKPDYPPKPDDICIPGTSKGDLFEENYGEPVAKNDFCELYINPSTTDIKVKVLSTGYEWSTAYSEDGFLSQGEIFTINYYGTSGKPNMMNTRDYIEKVRLKSPSHIYLSLVMSLLNLKHSSLILWKS